MPVMYVAIGRRLGYPMKLVGAKTHLFCRWDGGGERFNIEGASNGNVNYFDDDYYRKWPEPISDVEMATGEFLKSLGPTEELASFLVSRGACLQANNRLPEAMAAFSEAYRLMPKAITTRGSMLNASALVPVSDIEIFARRARAKGIGGAKTPLLPPNPAQRGGTPKPPGIRPTNPTIPLAQPGRRGDNP